MSDLMHGLDTPFVRDEPLGSRTWYGVGGQAEIFAQPQSLEQLAALAARCHQRQVPLRVLGAGANLLIRSGVVPGVVVALDSPAFTQLQIDHAAATITAGAGYDLFRLVTTAAREGLGGLEVVAGVPASVGGAIRMNAGGSYGEIGSVVHQVHVLSHAGQRLTRTREDLVFGYRRSNIAAPVILEATFQLTPGEPEELMRRVKEIFFYKRTSQPMGAHSAGCCFRNPEPERFAEGAEVMPAGMLIDRAGLKGFRHGAAEVSRVHANFITVDRGAGASAADDVIAVIEHIEQSIQERFGITLEREVVVWP